jgi:hypothetical protein
MLADPIVPCDDGHQLRRFAERLCRREVHGVECAERLDGKRSPDACQHVVTNRDDIAAALESLQCPNSRSLLIRG